MPIEIQPADLAPHLLAVPQQVVLPGIDAALVLAALVGAIEKNESPLSSGQPGPVHVMRSQRSDAARSHRLFPLPAVRACDLTVFETHDTMTRLVDDRLAALLF